MMFITDFVFVLWRDYVCFVSFLIVYVCICVYVCVCVCFSIFIILNVCDRLVIH